MLQITKKIDYGLTFLINLAKQNSGKPATLSEIARKNDLPRSFLAKLASLLVRAQIVKSKEGVNGGYVLAKNPDEISLDEILEVLENKKNKVLAGCNNSCGCQFCPERDVAKPVRDQIKQTLQAKTLADLMKDGAINA